MVKHYNYELPQQIADIFKIKGEELPQNISDDINLIYDIRPQITDINTSNAFNATSATILTTPSTVDYFLVGATLTVIKDATSQSVTSTIQANVNGTARSILVIGGLSLVPQSESISVMFPTPVKVERNTAITVTNSSNVANIRASAVIYGYRVE